MAKFFELRTEGFNKHTCVARREGNWLIFECPECSYARRWNPATSEMKLVDSGDEAALHSGLFQPAGLQVEKLNPN